MDFITKEVLIISIPLLAILIGLIYLYVRKFLDHKEIYFKYKDVIDIDKEVEKKNVAYEELKTRFNNLDNEFNKKHEELSLNYKNKAPQKNLWVKFGHGNPPRVWYNCVSVASKVLNP